MKKHTVHTLLLILVSGGLLPAASISLSIDTLESITLRDSDNNILADGSLAQFGYYTSATTGDLFAGDWVALTGLGSANPSFDTAVNGGSYGSEYAGQIFFDPITYGALNASIPSGTIFAVRFYDSPTIAGSLFYGAVSYAGAVLGDDDIITFVIGASGTTWLGGDVAFTGTAVPEPAAAAWLAGLGALGLVVALRRRRA